MCKLLDKEVYYLFFLGIFLSTLFYIEEYLTNEELRENSMGKTIVLLLINSFFGGFVMVTVFYGLEQYFPTWLIFVKVGVAGGVATMGKDAIKLFHQSLKKKSGV